MMLGGEARLSEADVIRSEPYDRVVIIWTRDARGFGIAVPLEVVDVLLQAPFYQGATNANGIIALAPMPAGQYRVDLGAGTPAGTTALVSYGDPETGRGCTVVIEPEGAPLSFAFPPECLPEPDP